jgi:hypothetical protein
LLAPRLKQPNAEALIWSAMNRSKDEITQLLAEHFPQSESLPLVQSIPATSHATTVPPGSEASTSRSGAPTQAEHHGADHNNPSPPGSACPDQLAPGQVAGMHAAAPLQRGGIEVAHARAEFATRSFVKPHAAGRYTLYLNLSRETYEKLRYVQELLSHQMPSADIAEVIRLALHAFVSQLEKRKFAATNRPRAGTLPARTGSRHIPSHVMRAVWRRDGGQCTFVGGNGQRCPARSFIEFDHIEPVARGGRATVDGIRLRCRTHNQYGAEQAFGAEFMNRKRRAAEGAQSPAPEEGEATE